MIGSVMKSFYVKFTNNKTTTDMKDIMIVLIMILPVITLILLAAYMMYIHQHGYGWVIAGAILIGGSMSIKSTTTD